METIFNPAINVDFERSMARTSLFAKFFQWCTAQNENRLLWLGVILAAHGCILTPVTAMIVLATGGNFTLFMVAMIAMAMALVTNLAAMPTKYTLPVFTLSVLLDIAVVIATLVSF